MPRPPSPHALMQFVARCIRRQEASGLRAQRFCSQEGIARSKFHALETTLPACRRCGAAPRHRLPRRPFYRSRFASSSMVPPAAADRGRPA